MLSAQVPFNYAFKPCSLEHGVTPREEEVSGRVPSPRPVRLFAAQSWRRESGPASGGSPGDPRTQASQRPSASRLSLQKGRDGHSCGAVRRHRPQKSRRPHGGEGRVHAGGGRGGPCRRAGLGHLCSCSRTSCLSSSRLPLLLIKVESASVCL